MRPRTILLPCALLALGACSNEPPATPGGAPASRPSDPAPAPGPRLAPAPGAASGSAAPPPAATGGSAAVAPTAAAAAGSPAEAPAPGPGGPATADDASLNAAAKRVVRECGAQWGPAGFPADCPAYRTFVALRAPEGHLTYLNLLGDADERMRFLGCRQLLEAAPPVRTNKTFATRILYAMEQEKGLAAGCLGAVAGHLDLAKVHADARVKHALQSPAVALEARTALVTFILAQNPARPTAYEGVKEALAQEKDPRFRVQAVRGLTAAAAAHADEVCQIWLDLAKGGRDDEAAREAAARVLGPRPWSYTPPGLSGIQARSGPVGENRCRAQGDQVLALLAQRAGAGAVQHSGWVAALEGAWRAPADPAWPKTAAAVLQATVGNAANHSAARSLALLSLADHDRAAARDLATKHAQDEALKEAAAQVLGSGGARR
jgi:hypothetical protein